MTNRPTDTLYENQDVYKNQVGTLVNEVYSVFPQWEVVRGDTSALKLTYSYSLTDH